MTDRLDPTPTLDHVDCLHGVNVADPYRWLEDAEDEGVKAWVASRNAFARRHLESLPQRAALESRFLQLWRYDDERPPSACAKSDRVFFETRSKDQDKWVVWMRDPGGEPIQLLDPNTWETIETLAWWQASPDGRFLAYGVAKGGDENPIGRVLDLETQTHTPDVLSGWRHHFSGWSHDNRGFFFLQKPAPGTVPEGEEAYWHRVAWHPLHSDGSADRVVHESPVKEHYHWTRVSQDGQWAVHYRADFDAQQIHLQSLSTEQAPIRPMVDTLDAIYEAEVLGDTILIRTDWKASRARVMVASTANPHRSEWREWIAEHPTDLLQAVVPVDGFIYLVYLHDAFTRIEVRTLDGELDHHLPLPGIGTASVSGYWHKGPVWVNFESYTFPTTTYHYDRSARNLELKWRNPIDVNPDGMVTDQVWVTSKDGTRVPMFLVRSEQAAPGSDHPVLLTGYGGFNLSRLPAFASLYVTFVQAGGVLAVPNLRGGGEYGQAWHEAGMREHKQNVFDDFIAAAEWLIDTQWTSPGRLAISGGSNGGLLVSAVMTQRPELFAAVVCQVPLTDMLRFPKFGVAKIWTREYGSPDDPEMFPYLHAYSPVHNTEKGTDYPALLVTAAANDARTDPVHARKFYAAIEGATGRLGPHERPILMQIYEAAGHGGTVTIAERAAEWADKFGFVMAQIGMTGP